RLCVLRPIPRPPRPPLFPYTTLFRSHLGHGGQPLMTEPTSAASLRAETCRHRDVALDASEVASLLGLLPGWTEADGAIGREFGLDRKSTRLNSSHVKISYAVFCLKKK